MKAFTTIGVQELGRIKSFIADNQELYYSWLKEQEGKEHD